MALNFERGLSEYKAAYEKLDRATGIQLCFWLFFLLAGLFPILILLDSLSSIVAEILMSSYLACLVTGLLVAIIWRAYEEDKLDKWVINTRSLLRQEVDELYAKMPRNDEASRGCNEQELIAIFKEYITARDAHIAFETAIKTHNNRPT